MNMEKQALLILKPCIERANGTPRACDDIADRRAVITTFGKQLFRSVSNPP
jgi:hypothetical protein